MKKLLTSKIVWVVVAVVVIGGGLYWRNAGKPTQPEYVTEAAKVDGIVQTVSATGQVKSASEIELNFKNSGTVGVVRAKTGNEVTAGDILAQLKATDLEIAITKARADLEEARANLSKVTVGATTEEIAVSEAAVAKAETDLATARTDLVNTEKTYRQAIENAKNDLYNGVNSALTKVSISLQRIHDTLFYEGDDDNFNTSNVGLEQTTHNGYTVGSGKVSAAQDAYAAAKLSGSDADLDTAISTTIDALDSVETTLENLTVLFGYVVLNPTLTQSELDTLKTTINTERTTTDTSVNTVNGDRQDLADARINYDTKIEAGQNAVSAAEQNLTKAKADLTLKKAAARPEDITLYQARLRRAEADLRLTQDRYEETILRAPIDGVVIEVNVSAGEQTSASEPEVKMLATENYEIEVDIPESDIAKITAGDPSEIVLDAFTDEDVFAGTVTTINPAQTEIQDVIYYRVTVSFSPQQSQNVEPLVKAVKPGMTADVTVETDRKENVLVIPSRAIKEKNGDKVVTVLENGQAVDKVVTIGLRGDEGFVEILTGLQAGDEIVTFVRNQ